MLEGFDIVCLGTVEWLVVRSVAEHTMLRLATKNRVLFVEPFCSLFTLIRQARWQRRRVKLSWGVRKIGRGLWVYSPPPIGLRGTSWFRWPLEVNGWILNKLIARVTRLLDFRDLLVWTYLSDSIAVVRRLPARLRIYDCIDLDEALARSEGHRRLVREREERLCRAVDIVFGVTDTLVTARRPFNANTFEVNCAADLEHFGKALLAATEIPVELARLGKPVLGYIGGVDPWKIDVQLLTYLARARAEWQIALVGYIWYGFDPECFRPYANIHVLGPKPYEEFPAYLKGMDVCLIPFPINEVTRNGDTLKLYECLAGGKPVVATPVPAALRLRDVVAIADNPAAFLAAIEESLREDPGAVRRRLDAVKSHTWERRVEDKSCLIARRLAETEGSRG